MPYKLKLNLSDHLQSLATDIRKTASPVDTIIKAISVYFTGKTYAMRPNGDIWVISESDLRSAPPAKATFMVFLTFFGTDHDNCEIIAKVQMHRVTS